MMRTRVVILDMQPITPAIGGGRQRLLGLYHALGDNIDAIYVGSYDWPGEAFRDQQLTPGLREICVPLSEEHHAAASASTERYGGRCAIDIEFHQQVGLSPDYLAVARREIANADVVVFTHPWCYPSLADDLAPNQFVVYDSQNVEAFLRMQLHGEVPEMEATLREVARIERDLLHRCDLVYCCSSEEIELYRGIFEVPLSKLRVAPNGTFLHPIVSADDGAARENAPSRYSDGGRSRPLVAFMGSQYGPNIEAGHLIVEKLALEAPNVDFVIIGGLGVVLDRPDLPGNIILTGVVSEESKIRWLEEADLAINPMTSGAGTNVKMFDFLAAGLPVISTKVGARGVVEHSTPDGSIDVVDVADLARSISTRLARGIAPSERDACRAIIDRRFNNTRISGLLGKELILHSRGVGVPRPKVALFAPWGIACGIGEHARYLAEGFRLSGQDPIILGNHVAHHTLVGFEGDLQFPVTRVWHWDNLHWCESTVDWNMLVRVLEDESPAALVIQHHSAYLRSEDWIRLVKQVADLGIPVIVECHDPRSVAMSDLGRIIQSGGAIAVHSEADHERLAKEGIFSSVVPLGVREVTKPEMIESPAELVIGGFGFLRPHKGIDVVLAALAQLSKESGIPRMSYRGWHAIYPGEENSDYVRRCQDIASEIRDRVDVDIRTDFLDIDEVTTGLFTCDVVALAYAPSDEGGSASASAAIGSGAAVACTPSGIFEDLGNTVLRSTGFTVPEFTAALRSLVLQDELRADYANRSIQLARKRGYRVVASQLYQLRTQGNGHVRQ